MRNFNRGECFDHHLRMPFLEPAKHVRVIRESQLWMQAADNVKLARRVVACRIGFGEYFFEAARIRAVFFGHARKRTEDAGVAQDADVGRIDVLVGGKVHSMAIAPSVCEVREVAEGEQIARCKKRETILARESLAAFDLIRNGDERWADVHYATLRTANVTLCPPKPNEFDSATSTCRCTAVFGAESRSHAGSALN